MRRLMIGVMTALLGATLLAQEPADPNVRPLTETQALRIQLVAFQQEVADLRGRMLVCQMETDNPGFKFDPSRGMVRIPEKAPEKK